MKLPNSVPLTPGKHLDVACHHNHYQLPSKEEQEYLFHNFWLDPNDKTPIKTKKGTIYFGEGNLYYG
jgi:hypothetical protein